VALSLYVHVPFCASRCGYCDFNTYTATELGSQVHRDTFHQLLADEVRYAAHHLPEDSTVSTIFFGGGTPTLIGAEALTEILNVIRDCFTVEADAEITTEANPDSVDLAHLEQLRAAGFTRLSFGMQSAAPHVLQTLDRTHSPGATAQAVRWARSAGFTHINLDLIYGTPGETEADLRTSLAEVLALDVDHVSAYALTVEEGTSLARRVARGEIPAPDDDVAAERYECIDDVLGAAGLQWYEISNWSRPGGQCRHNLAYWRNEDWWGIGPGAHSHLGGVRWWNVKHPATYADRIRIGASPMADEEHLTDQQRELERVMLGIRTRDGVSASDLPAAAADLVTDGLLDTEQWAAGRAVLTRRGRLLANTVVRALVP